jgi:hypothetical protein
MGEFEVSEYERLIEKLRKRWGMFQVEIPKINEANFICMVNDKEFLFSDGDTYNCDEIIDILNEEYEKEVQEDECWRMQMLIDIDNAFERYEI